MENFNLGEQLEKDHKDKKKGKVDKAQNIKPDDNEEKQVTNTHAEKLLKIVSNYELFHDEHEEPFTFIKGKVVSLNSNKFRQFLSHQFQKSEGKPPNAEAINQAITAMIGKALFEGDKKELHTRIAKADGAFYYDLGNGKAIRTVANGWAVVDAPILFRRYSHQQAQVQPIKGGDPRQLFDFINVSEENNHSLLLLALIISYFVPDIPHPILCLYGTQGAGKTSFFRIIKKLCDPSSTEVLIAPKDRTELVQMISHHHVCLLDNLSNMSSDMSDILCMACTGGGFTKRMLYSNDDDVIYSFKKCIGLNGINQLITKPDLMDRSILIQLERIAPYKRMSEDALWEAFDKKLPYILGGILDVLAKAIAIYSTIKLENSFRMADFMKWGCAITMALGIDRNEFIQAYQLNIKGQNEEVIQGSTLAQSVISLMKDEDQWEGTIRATFDKLEELAKPAKNDHTFPKSSNQLRRELEKIRANLIEQGISFTVGEHTHKGVPITFQKIQEIPSASSASSDTSNINELRPEDSLSIPDDADDGTKSSSGDNQLKYKHIEDAEEAEDKNQYYTDDPEVEDIEI